MTTQLTEPDYIIPPDQASAPAVCIKTYPSGTYFDLLDPKPEEIHLIDIAHHLSLLNRFVGGTPQAYSVGEHCLNVSAMVERRGHSRTLQLAALLHDASEAYAGDVSGLLKKTDELAGYRAIEDRISRAIEIRFNLPTHALDDVRVKQADKDAFEMECTFVRDSKVRIAPEPLDVQRAYVLHALGLLDQ